MSRHWAFVKHDQEHLHRHRRHNRVWRSTEDKNSLLYNFILDTFWPWTLDHTWIIIATIKKKTIVVHLTLIKTLERISIWDSNPGLSLTNNVTLDKSPYFFKPDFLHYTVRVTSNILWFHNCFHPLVYSRLAESSLGKGNKLTEQNPDWIHN